MRDREITRVREGEVEGGGRRWWGATGVFKGADVWSSALPWQMDAGAISPRAEAI